MAVGRKSLIVLIAIFAAFSSGKAYTPVLIEGKIPEDGVYIGRTYKDAPNVDGYIFVNAPWELMSGDIVPVRVTGASDYDLIGDVVDESAE